MSERRTVSKLIALPVIWATITVAALVLIEGLASWALAVQSVAFDERRQSHTRHDSLLGWSSRPGAVVPNAYGQGSSIQIDSLGFRGDGVDPAQESVRLVCSGDSFTFGQGVGNGEDWCTLLAQMLSNAETINMGQPGYGVGQAYLWYLRDGVPLNPHIHVFAFIGGDFYRMLNSVHYGVGKPVLSVSEGGGLETGNVPVPRMRHAIGRAVTRAELRLVRLGQGLISRLASSGSSASLPEPEAIRPLASTLFESLRAVNERNGTASLWVFLPTERDIEVDTSMRALAGEIADELGVAYLDLTEEMRALPAQRAARMFLPDGHYTVEGNQWVAEAVAEKLNEMGAGSFDGATPRGSNR